jgi:uncharacterized protein YcbK (DUF882 family)
VPVSYARHLLTAAGPSRAGGCAVLAAIVLLMGNNGLDSAVANGDTRTLSLHHIHTDEDITITYKRNGRYDDDALKQLDWFVRDWRKEEDIHMDPQLFDLIWEVSREVGGDKTIHVVCGYRSPGTNAMLRRRSSGVARFSQHTLGKAMDFYIPGASLEELRIAGLRMQRGGVGYYPSSGSPFVHLDVGSIRYWPRMTHDQLARVFPDGRTVHVPSDGHPLSGYSLALADLEKRGSSSGPSQMSLNAARVAGVDFSRVRKKNLLAALFGHDDEDDAEAAGSGSGAVAAAVSAPATASRGSTFALASVSKPEPIRSALVPAVPVPVARPPRPVAPLAVTPSSNDAVAARGEGTVVASAAPASVPAQVKTAAAAPASARSADPEVTASTMPWPVRAADNDHVPLDMVLAYAAQPQPNRDAQPALRPEPMGETPVRAAATTPAKTATLRDNVTTIAKKSVVRPAAAEPIQRAKATLVVANAGMRYDDPWLRAMILTPSISNSMTATLYGERDFTELRALMNKPSSSIVMSFNDEPGIATDRFRGEAIVFLTTYVFSHRTASLR